MTPIPSSHNPDLPPRPGEDLMCWLDRNTVHYLQELVRIACDTKGETDRMRLEALKTLLAYAVPVPRK